MIVFLKKINKFFCQNLKNIEFKNQILNKTDV